MDRLEFYRDIYKESTQQIESINSSSSVVQGLLALLGAGIGYIISEYKLTGLPQSGYWSIALLTICVLFIISCVYWFSAIHGYKLMIIDNPQHIYDTHVSLDKFHQNALSTSITTITPVASERSDTDITDALIAQYAQSADVNQLVYIRKRAYLYNSRSAVAIGLVCWVVFIVSASVFGLEREEHQSSTKIVNVKELDSIIMNMATQKPPSPAPAPTTTTTPKQPIKPTLNPPRTIKETTIPKKPSK